jgi:AraC-like DNA-binding protein
MARIEDVMARHKFYRDENLNLSRLARKLAVPSRQISNAINRATGGNVSQYINQLRVKDACRLLEETDQSVTSIMFESGFQTKSNFNREFRRITGMNPLAWREREVWKLVSAHKNGHPA